MLLSVDEQIWDAVPLVLLVQTLLFPRGAQDEWECSARRAVPKVLRGGTEIQSALYLGAEDRPEVLWQRALGMSGTLARSTAEVDESGQVRTE